MNPGAESGGGYAVDVLATLASGLGVDSRASGRKAMEVVRARSPELTTLSEQTGEDLVTTAAGFIDMLLASLRSDVELPWTDFEQRSRDYGRLRAAQGLPLESLIDVLAVYRRATIELLSRPIQGKPHYDEIIALAQSRLEDMTERLTTAIARGYLDYVDEEHRARESEMYGLAAIMTAMGRSLDLLETAEVALVESLAALRLSTGAMWLRERSSYKVAHTVGLDQDQVDDFARQVGPHAKAAASAARGRSAAQVMGRGSSPRSSCSAWFGRGMCARGWGETSSPWRCRRPTSTARGTSPYGCAGRLSMLRSACARPSTSTSAWGSRPGLHARTG